MRMILPSFAGGEWAPDMYGRVDLEKYSISCKNLQNFLVNPTGSASNRPGTEYIATVKDSTKKTRLIPFEYSTEQAYMLEFGDGYIRFYMGGGQIAKSDADSWVTETDYVVGDWVEQDGTFYYCLVAHTSGTFVDDLAAGYWEAQTIYEIVSPYAADDLALIKYVQSADTMYLAHPGYAPRTLVRNGHDDWTMSEFAYENGPFMSENTDEDLIAYATATTGKDINLYLGAKDTSITNTHLQGMAGSLFRLSHDVESYSLSSNATRSGLKNLSGSRETTGVTSSIACLGSWSLTLSASGWGSVKLQSSNDGETWTDVATYTANTSVSGNNPTNILYRLYFVSISTYYDSNSESYKNYPITYNLTCNQALAIPANDLTTVDWRFVTHGTWAGKFHIQKSTDQGTTWKTLESYSGSSDYNVSTSGTVDEACWLRVYMYEYSSGTMYYDFYVDAYTHNGVVKITSVTMSTDGGLHWIVKADVQVDLYSTDETMYWAKGSWSENNGYPRCVEFYQDRLGFASTSAEPQTEWWSQTGDYSNFGVSSDLQDTDRISLTLVSRKVNQIKNMVGLGEIISLTSAANWIVGPGSASDSFTPSNSRAVCQGYRGCTDVQPVVIENRIIYVQAQNTNIRDLAYQWESESWAGDSLSIVADHLLRGYEIVDMAYQQDPHSVVWLVRSDGVLLGLTYLKEQQVLAWHHHVTDGTFESVAVIPGDDYDEAWFIVNRDGIRYIERMKLRMESTETADQFFMDCGLTYSGDAATVISGLTHLEGKTVVALADGFVVKNLTVTDGQITLPFAATKVHIGLPYVSDFVPLNLEIPLQNGTSQGLDKHIAEVTLRLQNSLGGYVGRDEDHLDEIIYRSNEPLDQCLDLYTGDKTIPLYSDWSAEESFMVRQTDPLPITILAAIVKVEFGQ
jgi:hypothetical protein